MHIARAHAPVLGAGLGLIVLTVGLIVMGPRVDASTPDRAGYRARSVTLDQTGMPVNDDYRFGGIVATGGSGPGGCVGDIDDTGDVGFNDLVILLASWGPCPGCAADLDNSGDVGFNDLVVLLASWGPCP